MTMTTSPLSKRSRRLLEEVNRHIDYALRGVQHLSVVEYEKLSATCAAEEIRFDLGDRLDGLRRLHRAIQWHLGARS
ncbi:MAG: hypothetical protein Q8N51_08335 [Gammaproteobacteria bacterium]|nr:hypothetical protein [Gammaproteobacteria bacterium]